MAVTPRLPFLAVKQVFAATDGRVEVEYQEEPEVTVSVVLVGTRAKQFQSDLNMFVDQEMAKLMSQEGRRI